MINRLLHVLAFVAGFLLVVLLSATPPIGEPDATIDLATSAGMDLVKGQWRYSDTKIVEADFRAADQDGQPNGPPNKTYDFTPHAGGADFDDSA